MDSTLPLHAGKLFKGQRIDLANARYIDCVFDRCEMVFAGHIAQLEGCDVQYSNWIFDGPAHSTIMFLRSLQSSGDRRSVANCIGVIMGMTPDEVLKALP